MAHTNSQLVVHANLSPNKTSPRNHQIDTITIHVIEGQVTAERLGEEFANPDRRASANYSVDKDGRVGMYVEEKDRAWTSGSATNDNRAITIEVASDTEPPYKVNDNVLDALVELLGDICKRNDIPALLWKNDKSLVGKVDKQNMTVHKWFQDTSCPGEYMMGKMSEIAERVNAKLGAKPEEKPAPAPSSKIKKDDIVRIKPGATYSNGIKVPSMYIGKDFSVMDHMNKPARTLIRELYSWVDDKYIETTGKKTPDEIKSGSKVEISAGAVYTNGVKVPSSCIGVPYTVYQIYATKALLREIMSWVDLKYLKLI